MDLPSLLQSLSLFLLFAAYTGKWCCRFTETVGGRGKINMALWRVRRWSKLSALVRLNRYSSTVGKEEDGIPEDDSSKPEPPDGFLFNEKVPYPNCSECVIFI